VLPTQNDLPKEVRKRVCKLLQGVLLDVIDLSMQAKVAHWNVRGPRFISLHELFDKVAEALEGEIDDVAERIGQLGGMIEGTAQSVAKGSSLKPYKEDLADGTGHVEALSAAVAAAGKRVRGAIDEAAKLGDADSADLLTGLSRTLDKQLWFVEAHAQARS
jgi:starvation-inducible DNA-binding protein